MSPEELEPTNGGLEDAFCLEICVFLKKTMQTFSMGGLRTANVRQKLSGRSNSSSTSAGTLEVFLKTSDFDWWKNERA